MANAKYEEIAQQLLDKNPHEWGEYLDGLKLAPSELSEVERIADFRAQCCAMLSGYLEMRGTSGCGDHGHAEALDSGKKKFKKVRKALGYNQ